MTSVIKQLMTLRELLVNSMSISRELRLELLIKVDKELEKLLEQEHTL